MQKKSNKKRADGRIAVQVYIGIIDGKRKYKTVYGKTQKEAEQKADEIKAAMNKGVSVSRGNSFDTWAQHYLRMKSVEVGANQYNLIKNRAEFWCNAIGNIEVRKIRVVDLQPVFTSLAQCNPHTGKPSAKKTLSSYKQILVAIFDYAIDNRVLDYNPAIRLKLPQDAPKSQRRALTQEERNRVVEFEHKYKPAIMLLMFSGLRRGEATALLWSDIDLNKSVINVTKSYDFKSKEIKTPKNGKSRTVTIPSILVDFLKQQPKTSTFVLTTNKNTMLTETAWKRMLESYLFDMNLEYGNFTKEYKKFTPEKIPFVIDRFTLHCLRHTFCTMMYEAGIDVLVAQQQMGHSDPRTTLDIYTHLQNEHRNNNITKLDEYLLKQA